MCARPHLRAGSALQVFRTNESRISEDAVQANDPLLGIPECRPGAARALVIEPDEHVRHLAEMALGDVAPVLACVSPESALAALQSNGDRIALVLADLHLGGPLSGLALADEIATHWPAARMVFTSGVVDRPETLPRSIGFLPKPWRCAELLAEARDAGLGQERVRKIPSPASRHDKPHARSRDRISARVGAR